MDFKLGKWILFLLVFLAVGEGAKAWEEETWMEEEVFEWSISASESESEWFWEIISRIGLSRGFAWV